MVWFCVCVRAQGCWYSCENMQGHGWWMRSEETLTKWRNNLESCIRCVCVCVCLHVYVCVRGRVCECVSAAADTRCFPGKHHTYPIKGCSKSKFHLCVCFLDLVHVICVSMRLCPVKLPTLKLFAKGNTLTVCWTPPPHTPTHLFFFLSSVGGGLGVIWHSHTGVTHSRLYETPSALKHIS